MPNWRHSTAIFSPSSSRATNLSRSSIGLHSLQGTFALLAKGPVCNPCLRNELSPFSQEGQLDRPWCDSDLRPVILTRGSPSAVSLVVKAPTIAVVRDDTGNYQFLRTARREPSPRP